MPFVKRFQFPLLAVLALSGGCLYAFPAATVAYGVLVLSHLIAGILLSIALVRVLRGFSQFSGFVRLGWLLIALGAMVGIVLIFTGTPRPMRVWLLMHLGLSAVGILLLAYGWLISRQRQSVSAFSRFSFALLGFIGVFAGAAILAAGAWWLREARWQRAYRITNPAISPASMDSEGDGPSGPFFPSSAQTVDGGKIPAKFFMQSASCERCHSDIYKQWYSSAHHFSSFNNQWYRKSIEYMQDVAGVRSSKWCAGCHDPALFFSGKFDTPIRNQIHSPEAQAGLSCVMCHTIVQVKSTMGQGDYIIEYPKLHELAASENFAVRALHDFLVKVNPEPHRRTFLKPFVKNQTADFCSTCHKVHLDVPVNRYRWIRGFNEYDNWQASGVSGQGARSFYYPATPQKCADCHMPPERSHDFGNQNGFVHSHRFPAANTALPFVNQDAEQLAVVENFLKDKQVSLDIFGISPELAPVGAGGSAAPEFATTFAVGEEALNPVANVVQSPVAPLTAPLNRVQPALRRGDTVRLDVVVRTRKVGHFFPGGTVDAFDCWLELTATDEKGRNVFWSGRVEDDGKGPVEKGAHFYRSLQVDARGNEINKRNAWSTRAVVYVRLIPPGAADTVHYRLHIPEHAGEQITLHAKLNYRKFSRSNTLFSFAGVRDPSDPHPDVTPDYDSGRWLFNGPTKDVSGNIKAVPDIPIVTLAEDRVTLRVLARGTKPIEPRRVLKAEDWQRWNDYGIGLLLQGDLRGAAAAFEAVTQIDPQNPDGWVNIGRATVQEGNLQKARQVLDKALALKPALARAHFFYSQINKEEGQYEEAVSHLQKVLSQYPRDRVARNQLGRVLFLERQYRKAIPEFLEVLTIDPEDLQANYNLMLCYNGLGETKMALEYQVRYLRFKADESSQTITGPYRQKHPEDNNERQAIHEHVSVPLPVPFVSAVATAARIVRGAEGRPRRGSGAGARVGEN
ncbi:MAG TPA: tetratricopeptide repeat protein [Candidatus Dormibacteraeota bacterium]|nr:tetratricopeptide repeat protein [Candidatus Dormibacteraeota bacterium]